MTDVYTLSDEIRILDEVTNAALHMKVDASATAGTKTTIIGAQTNNVNVTLDTPASGQVIRASSTNAATWNNPIDIRNNALSLNANNFHTLDFIGSGLTVTDYGNGIARINSTAITSPTERKQFDAFANTSQLVQNTATTILFDVVRMTTGGSFTLTAGEVTINSEDTYVILFSVTTDIDVFNQPAISRSWLEVDTGSGFNAIAGSYVFNHNQNVTVGEQTASTHVIHAAQIGYIYRVRTQRFAGSGSVRTVAAASSITFVTSGPSTTALTIQDESSNIGSFTTLNFVGANVTATDAGGGVAEINVTAQTTPPRQFDVYASTAQLFSNTPITVLYNTVRRNTGEFVLSSGQVTVNAPDYYLILFSVTTDIASFNQPAIVHSWLEVNNVMVPGSSIYSHNASSVVGEQTASTQLVHNTSSGDVFRVRTVRFAGSGNTSTISSASSLTFVNTGGVGSTLAIKDEGSSLGSFNTMNFVGNNIIATDAGGGQVNVTVSQSTIDVKDEGSTLGSFTALDFVGASVNVTDLGGGVAQVAMISHCFDAYATTTQPCISTVTILYDTIRKNTGAFTLSAGEVTVNVTDTFFIFYTVTTDISAFNQTAITRSWLEIDTGSGFNPISGSDMFSHNKNSAEGEQTASTHLIYDVVSGYKFRVRTNRFAGTGNTATKADASRITFKN